MTRRSYTAEQRAEARAAYEEHGPREAERMTGIPHGTITKWAKAGGWEPRFLEEATADAQANHLRSEERRARLADNLLEIAELGTDQTKRMLAEAGLRDVVGAWTRAIHDHQLLSGNPTGRVATQEERDQAMTEARERSLRLVASN